MIYKGSFQRAATYDNEKVDLLESETIIPIIKINNKKILKYTKYINLIKSFFLDVAMSFGENILIWEIAFIKYVQNSLQIICLAVYH